MTHFDSITCLTIVAEAIIEDRLLRTLESCGARGWTVSMAQGHGPDAHGVSGIEGGNTRIETLVPDDVATRIWDVLERDYFPHYAVSAWAYDVRVARIARYA
jgi:nitrogen regulatory protein P-II 2